MGRGSGSEGVAATLGQRPRPLLGSRTFRNAALASLDGQWSERRHG